MSCVPRRGEKEPRGMEVGEMAGPWWGRVSATLGAGKCGGPLPGSSESSLPGLRPAPAQPLP